MTIYLDVVLLENILMNILIIYLANYLSKRKNTFYKICISSIIGAVYYIVLLLPENSFLNFYLYKIILSIIMVAIGFNSKNIFDYVSNIMFFYISSFILGGAMYGIYYLISNNTSFEYYSLKIAILSIIVVIIAIRNIVYYIYLNSKLTKLIYQVDIYVEDKIKRIAMFLDTGNSLKDPISNKPIVVVNLESIKNILPQNIYKLGKSGISDINNIADSKVHIIPYISVGNQNGLMVGYRADKLVINLENGEKLKFDSIILGLNTTNLNSMQNADGLISMEFLERGGMRYEHGKVKV